MKHFEKGFIPPFMAHLARDERGYPIPYFVAIVNGKPDFRLLDAAKQKICAEHRKCAICGEKLIKGVYYFISGPLGAKNQVSTDPPMHRECAEFSMQVCPHLHFEKATRRDNNLPAEKGRVIGGFAMIMDKPDCMFVITADKYKTVPNPADKSALLFKYHAVKIRGYVYQKGILTAVD